MAAASTPHAFSLSPRAQVYRLCRQQVRDVYERD